jgi:hypothetical protein
MVSDLRQHPLNCRTSVEVDTQKGRHSAIVLAFEQGQPIWRLEVVGVKPFKTARALGSVAESFTGVSAMICHEVTLSDR